VRFPRATRHLEVGGEGFDFLGFHHRLVRSRGLNGKKPVTFLARWPADKAMQHARDRIRELTRRSRLLLPQEWIVEHLNQFLGGWAAYCVSRGHARWDWRAVGLMI
jgi:RNA-directed DNA polymerase